MKRSHTHLLPLSVCIARRAQNAAVPWPGCDGVAEGRSAPVKWDAEKGRASSGRRRFGPRAFEPNRWGDRVFVTTPPFKRAEAGGALRLYGDVEPVKNDPNTTWKVYALDSGAGRSRGERVAFEACRR